MLILVRKRGIIVSVLDTDDNTVETVNLHFIWNSQKAGRLGKVYGIHSPDALIQIDFEESRSALKSCRLNPRDYGL